MTPDQSLAAFITARLDDQQEAARGRLTLSQRAGGAVWRVEMHDPLTRSIVAAQPDSPQATLDRVEATRLVVAMHRRHVSDVVSTPPFCDCCPWPYPCPTLRALAWTWRRHEAWRAEWAPDGVVAGA